MSAPSERDREVAARLAHLHDSRCPEHPLRLTGSCLCQLRDRREAIATALAAARDEGRDAYKPWLNCEEHAVPPFGEKVCLFCEIVKAEARGVESERKRIHDAIAVQHADHIEQFKYAEGADPADAMPCTFGWVSGLQTALDICGSPAPASAPKGEPVTPAAPSQGDAPE